MTRVNQENVQKQELRVQALPVRREFRNSNLHADAGLAEQLKNGISSLRSPSGIWVGYKAVRSEANPELAIQTLGGLWAYPKVSGENLNFYLVSEKSKWSVGPFGIPEPDPLSSEQIDINQAEGVLVPGVVFDRRGNRLGSGQAFYDRALSHYKGQIIGVAYSVQIQTENLPFETHDIRMDYIATEKEFSAVEG